MRSSLQSEYVKILIQDIPTMHVLLGSLSHNFLPETQNYQLQTWISLKPAWNSEEESLQEIQPEHHYSHPPASPKLLVWNGTPGTCHGGSAHAEYKIKYFKINLINK